MPVVDIAKSAQDRSITITAEFAAPREKVWQVYEDPSQLELVWGPPTHPAKVASHSLAPGGLVHYFMTGPEGERYYGGWRVLAVDKPNSFTFVDFFADESFSPTPDLPISRNTYTFESSGQGTRAIFTSRYETADALQQVLDLGMEDGARQAINQIDGLLAAKGD